MKRFSFGLLALVCVLSVSAVQAGTVRFGGDVGLLPAGTTSGVLEVIMDLEPQDNFVNGGINFSINAATLGVVTFDSVAVNGTWQLNNSAIANGGSRINIALESVSPGGTGGIPTGSQAFVLATIPYTVVGTETETALGYVVDVDSSLVDGRDFGTNVTGNYTFQAGLISLVPEPTSLVMAGMSVMALAFRRRNG
jgi:hypothetical protein